MHIYWHTLCFFWPLCFYPDFKFESSKQNNNSGEVTFSSLIYTQEQEQSSCIQKMLKGRLLYVGRKFGCSRTWRSWGSLEDVEQGRGEQEGKELGVCGNKEPMPKAERPPQWVEWRNKGSKRRRVNLLGVAIASVVLYLKGAKLNFNSQGEVRWLSGSRCSPSWVTWDWEERTTTQMWPLTSTHVPWHMHLHAYHPHTIRTFKF